MTPETATNIAISGLEFIAGDEEQLSRFLALTGVEPGQVRELASSNAFLAAVLDFFMGDEATLLAFAASKAVDPSDVQKARYTLSPPENTDW